MSDKEQGDNCTFIFKKRCLKSRGSRQRHHSTSEEGYIFFYSKVMLCVIYFIADEFGSDTQSSSVVRPTKRKLKHNPNVQRTDALLKKQKKGVTNSSESSSDEERIALSYKSKRSAMSEGPQDQGATAVLVCFENRHFGNV